MMNEYMCSDVCPCWDYESNFTIKGKKDTPDITYRNDPSIEYLAANETHLNKYGRTREAKFGYTPLIF